MDTRAEAVRLFDMGFADKLVGRLLGIPHDTVRKWLYAYRALGREALFVTKHRTYSHDLKVEAAKAVIEGRMTKPEAMESYGLKSKTQIDTWCRLYREGGPTLFSPSPRAGRRRRSPSSPPAKRSSKRGCASWNWSWKSKNESMPWRKGSSGGGGLAKA